MRSPRTSDTTDTWLAVHSPLCYGRAMVGLSKPVASTHTGQAPPPLACWRAYMHSELETRTDLGTDGDREEQGVLSVRVEDLY